MAFSVWSSSHDRASQRGRVQWPSATAGRLSSIATSTTTPRRSDGARAAEPGVFDVAGLRSGLSPRHKPIAGQAQGMPALAVQASRPGGPQLPEVTTRDHRSGQSVRTDDLR